MSIEPLRLHVGSGNVRKPGWVNIDLHPNPNVDVVLDVRGGLPYQNVKAIFAEHFIEHLAWDDGIAFLRECRRVLIPEGVLRLSTPNLDWVWQTQYHLGQWTEASEAIRDCFWMNKAFRGWGHQFLYNLQTLTATLRAAGFATIDRCRYGESAHPDLRGLEEHEQYPDAGIEPHVIVVEASGAARPDDRPLKEPLSDYRSAVSVS